jgi:hypothetical protein
MLGTLKPLDITAAIADLRAQEQRAKEAQQRAEIQEEQGKRTLRRAAFERWIAEAFSPALLQALGYQISQPTTWDVRIVFTYQGIVFIGTWGNDRIGLTTEPESSYQYAYDTESFLRAIAFLHETATRLHAQRAAEEQAKAERLAAEEQAKAERLAAAERAHERCLARVEESKAATVPWVWTAGRDLTKDGEIAILPQRYRMEGRVVMVRYAVPGAERLTIRRVADLPSDLRVPRTITLQGMRYDYDQRGADGEALLCEDAESELKIALGDEWPVAWVREAMAR